MHIKKTWAYDPIQSQRLTHTVTVFSRFLLTPTNKKLCHFSKLDIRLNDKYVKISWSLLHY